jgi:hypothetical protein
MNNKYILVGIILISFLFLLSCGNTNNTSDDDGPKTLEELKDKKVNDPSEYDKCLKEIEENEKKQEECSVNKLKENGYTDGVDCIQDFNDPVCGGDMSLMDCYNDDYTLDEECEKKVNAGHERYNAEVDAGNECIEEFKGGLTFLDCAELIGK